MALILNIDTSTDYASIAISLDGKLVELMKNPELRDHASWIHMAIRELLGKTGYSLNQLEAIAVTMGPGSYTGLRIGMSTAKGLCYILKIPLITENTLKVMAMALLISPEGKSLMKEETSKSAMLIPMIDARRMEVYTAAYDLDLHERMTPMALVLDRESFKGLQGQHLLICFGSGSKKFEPIAPSNGFRFVDGHMNAGALSQLSHQKFLKKEFADLAYVEPLYLKEFFSTGKK